MSVRRGWQSALVASTLLACVSCALPYAGTPYKGHAVELPGRVHAEFFDVGGQSVAYNNIESPGDAGMPVNVIRVKEDGVPVSVQINDVSTVDNPAASEPAGSMAVGMIVSGEWLRFTVDVPVGGFFVPQWRLAAFTPDGTDVPVSTKVILHTMLVSTVNKHILLQCTDLCARVLCLTPSLRSVYRSR
jgi:hypothetical protein